MVTDVREHWQNVYGTKAPTEVSWYQAVPQQSLDLIRSAAPSPDAAIVDIGGGASTLVDSLIKIYSDVTVLDISEAALAQSKARLGEFQRNITWIVADVTRWRPARRFDVWHDRAVFHFLTEPAQQDAYITALSSGTKPGSSIIISTFALDGPDKCSGLPVERYSALTLASRLGGAFKLIEQTAERHKTPWGSEQSFIYAVLRRQ